MYIDARSIDKGTVLRSDVCVIGAGAAGITIGRALAGTTLKVCVLESGGLNSGSEAQDLYAGENVGLPYFPLTACRLRYFGGTTNHWAGWCAPLDPIDFSRRPWIPHSGWPIGWKALEPYYISAQRLCELNTFQYEPAYWKDKFHDGSTLPFDPSRLTNHVIQFSPPTRFGRRYRDDLVNAQNITVVTHANVTEIDTPPSASTVSGLQVQCLNGNSSQAEADQYVLACGGIENPRLLLNSNQYAPRGLGNDHDLVGRFFMEHPRMVSSSVLLTDRKRLSPYRYGQFQTENLDTFFQLGPSVEQQQSAKLLNTRVRFFLESSGYFSARRLLQNFWVQKLRFGNDLDQISEAVGNVLADFEGVAIGINSALHGKSPYNGFRALDVQTIVEQAPNPDSRVMLAEEHDGLGQRRVKLNWQLSNLEKRSILYTNRLLARELGRTGLGRLRLKNWLQDSKRAWPPDLEGGYHHMGTTRMGSTPHEGVCDSQCRVHGINNLYIAGSSVFPTSGRVPPTLTIVALSLRLAYLLKRI